MKVDIHNHFMPPITRQQASLPGWDDAPWLRDHGDGTGSIMTGDHEFRPVEQRLWDGDARLAEMDTDGVTVQLMSATPVLFNYAGEATVVARWASMLNDMAVEMCAADPHRLRPLSQVPLQDVAQACAEASRARDSGHVGVHIGNHVRGRNLDDPDLVRFLHHCADEEIPVVVHPWDTMAPDRMPRYMLAWLVGMPAETHLAILSLILSGGFERLPKNLRLCFTHGGGNFAQQLARVDNAWRRRDIVRVDCPRPPSSYVDRFSVDSVVLGDEPLRLLVSTMGPDRIMMGSDYPFPLGEELPGRVIVEADHLDDADKGKLLWENANRFFGLQLGL